MFSEDHYNFPYPLFVTSVHMLVQWSLSAVTLTIFRHLRPTSRPSAPDYAFVSSLFFRILPYTALNNPYLLVAEKLRLAASQLDSTSVFPTSPSEQLLSPSTVCLLLFFFPAPMYSSTLLTMNSHVQILFPRLCPPLRLPLPPRSPLLASRRYHPDHHLRRHPHGLH
jgi:hypothetical protein